MGLFSSLRRFTPFRSSVPLSAQLRIALDTYVRFVQMEMSRFTATCLHLQNLYAVTDDFLHFLQEHYQFDDWDVFSSRVSSRAFVDESMLIAWIEQDFFEMDLLELTAPYALLPASDLLQLSSDALPVRAFLKELGDAVLARNYEKALAELSTVAHAATAAFVALRPFCSGVRPTEHHVGLRSSLEFWLHAKEVQTLLKLLQRAKKE